MPQRAKAGASTGTTVRKQSVLGITRGLHGPPLPGSLSFVANGRPFSSLVFWLGLGVMLFAVGGKLTLIDRYGTDQPYADQWAAEGMYFLRGPLYYDVDWKQITATHGEHRPGLTRLWVLALVRGNGGQWDCFVELVANLLIFGGFLMMVWQWVSRLTDRLGLWFSALLAAGLFALPGAYENFLWGFQSCFLFMLLLGFLHISWTMQATRLDWRWGLAQLAGFLGLFSIASGAMSAATLVVAAALAWVRGRKDAWVAATVIVNALLFGLGLWLLPGGGEHSVSVITRLSDALMRAGYLLAWPFPASAWGLLLHVPWVVLLISLWRGKGDAGQTQGDWLTVAVALWGACSCFAIAYGREITAETIGVRYLDGLILGLLVNFVALLRLQARMKDWRRWAWRVGLCIWIGCAGLGLWMHNRPDRLAPALKYQRDQAVEQREIVRDFLATSDPARLEEFAAKSHRFPHLNYTLIFLRDPQVRPLLPPSLTPDGRAGPLSRGAVIIAGLWPWVLGSGAILLLVGLFNVRKNQAVQP